LGLSIIFKILLRGNFERVEKKHKLFLFQIKIVKFFMGPNKELSFNYHSHMKKPIFQKVSYEMYVLNEICLIIC